MNKKGFTLIELLAVIIVLASVSLIVVSSVTSSLTKREGKECEEQIELAKTAAKLYFSLNGGTSVTIKTLRDGEYFNEKSKSDRLKDTSTITISGGKYVYNGNCN